MKGDGGFTNGRQFALCKGNLTRQGPRKCADAEELKEIAT
jgi:hypothetical protein